MSGYSAHSLFDADKLVTLASKKNVSKKQTWNTGCPNCPLDIGAFKPNKILGIDRIKGRKVMIWSQAPDRKENAQKEVMTGPGADWFWSELAKVQIEREDCDIQTVCRCWPTNTSAGQRVDRDPTDEELHHCSIFNDRAIDANRGNAVLHIVLGKLAAKALLGKEYRGDKLVFWSNRLQAMVVVTDHPKAFGGKFPGWRLYEFRDRLRAARAFLKHPGRHGYLQAQDYKPIATAKNAEWLKVKVRDLTSRGIRVSVDVEEGSDPETGSGLLLMVGFAWDMGTRTEIDVRGKEHVVPVEPDEFGRPKAHARSIILDHPENLASSQDKEACWLAVQEMVEDVHVKKTFHYGSSDVRAFARYGIKVRGYTYDTIYAAYFRWPHKQKYGLDEMSVFAFPEFAGYKQMLTPHYQAAEGNYARIPLKVLTTYNCADADLTRRLDVKTDSYVVNKALLKTYISAAFIVDRMETKGPIFDTQYKQGVVTVVPQNVERLAEKIRVFAGNPDLNPNTPAQIAHVLYDQLQLESPDPKRPRSTAEDIMLILAQQHEFPKTVLEYRKFFKMDSTYLKGYQRSADMNGGELRTKWHLTGTVTGRLRSGGKEDGAEGIVNFQNLHGNALLQNLLISDPNWRWVIQNKPYEQLRRLRAFFALDYSQIEIRVLAMVSGDKLLIEQFNIEQSGTAKLCSQCGRPECSANWDVHCLVGNTLTGWDTGVIRHDKEKRTMIKQLHFGIVYGMSEESAYQDVTSKGVKIGRNAFGKLYKAYFIKYKGVKAYIDRMHEQAERDGFVETMFGFRRELGTWDTSRNSQVANQAVNSPIQGSAHQLVLMAMANLYDKPKTYNMLQETVMEVHDALYFFGDTDDLPVMFAQGKHLLEHSVTEYVEKNFGKKLKVPLVAEGKATYRMGVEADYFGEPGPVFIDNWRKKNLEVEAKVAKEFGLAA